MAVAAGGAGRAGGRGSLGLLAGPRARALRLAGRRGPRKLDRAAGWEAFFSSSFSIFHFFFHLFEFKFGLEFEFKTEVTYLLEFREFCLIITF